MQGYPLVFCKSMIPGGFKSNDFVSVRSRGLTGAFFVSADSKGVTSVDTVRLDSARCSRKTVTPYERTSPGEYKTCRRGPWTFALLDSAWGAQGKRYTAKRHDVTVVQSAKLFGGPCNSCYLNADGCSMESYSRLAVGISNSFSSASNRSSSARRSGVTSICFFFHTK